MPAIERTFQMPDYLLHVLDDEPIARRFLRASRAAASSRLSARRFGPIASCPARARAAVAKRVRRVTNLSQTFECAYVRVRCLGASPPPVNSEPSGGRP